MRSLHPDVADALKLPKRDTPRSLKAVECSLASPTAQPQQHKHSITVEQLNTATITSQPVVRQSVVTDVQKPKQYSYKGLSVSPKQLSELEARGL